MNKIQEHHCLKLFKSYQIITGKKLFDVPYNKQLSLFLKNNPFPIASHNNAINPKFDYANNSMLLLFGMTESEFIGSYSKYSASSINQNERARLLNEVRSKGYIENYQGFRIKKDKTQFFIKKSTIWNLLDEKGNYDGQAVIIYEWDV